MRRSNKNNIKVEDFREPIVPDDVSQHVLKNFDFYQRLSVDIKSLNSAQELGFLHDAIRRLPEHEKVMFWDYLRSEITKIRGGQLRKTTPFEDEHNAKNRKENIKNLLVIFSFLAIIGLFGITVSDCSNSNSKREEYSRCIDAQNMASQDLQRTKYSVDSSETRVYSEKTYETNDGYVTVRCNKSNGKMEISTSKN